MRLGVISDTHDRLANIDLACAYFHSQKVDLIVHCGDWKNPDTVAYLAEKAARLSLPVRGVLGNNDLPAGAFLEGARTAAGDFQLHELAFELPLENGKKLAVHHGHHKPTLRRLMADDTVGILLLGHTHKPKIENIQGKLIVNPGSTAFAIPRSKAWRPSVAIVDTQLLGAEITFLA